MADDKNPAKPSLGVVRGSERAAGKEADMAVDVDNDVSVNEQLETLRTELHNLRVSAGLVAEGTGQLALSQAMTLRDEAEDLVISNPFTALLGAAFVGYLFGLRR